jgi:hypothetical protein
MVIPITCLSIHVFDGHRQRKFKRLQEEKEEVIWVRIITSIG